MNNYKMTVGLEVHVELKTETKIFCSCPSTFGAEPNTCVCPVCLGLPGAMPSLNRRVVEYAIKAGLATNCEISKISGIDRKNYFYPDLPKGYQISQYFTPICHGGYIDIKTENTSERIGITRIHIEEDAGKLIHDKESATLIDHNRCGVPLIEIVSEPDIHSPESARAYLKKLRSILVAIGISDCKMNEGSMRCDVNLSVAPADSDALGERTEIKNINSFSFVAKAIESEFKRQCDMIEKGETVKRQTLRFNAASGKCEVMRTKESATDYRFFPEPDLHSLLIEDEDIARIKKELPTLPDQRKAIYIDKLGLPEYDSEQLSADIALSDFFEAAAQKTQYIKILANLLLGEIARLSVGEEFFCPIAPDALAKLCKMLGEERINSSAAKKLISLLWNEPAISPEEIAEREDLWQINDQETLRKIATEALNVSQKALADYKGGKSFALRAIVGKAMAQSRGKANPQLIESIIIDIIKNT
jgi:aspartyl-tRNA(Asn)/glutamyl-tRNA(Gln) amidotransferase subunit B